jgi:hypothetical protein
MGYYQCQIEGLHVPLCTLIDYRGFRLIAMSILPLYYGGLVYGITPTPPTARPPPCCGSITTTVPAVLTRAGVPSGSNDGGLSIHADDPLMNHMMKRAAKKLNIKGHVAGRAADKKFIYGTCRSCLTNPQQGMSRLLPSRC